MLFGAGKFDDVIGEMNLFSSVRAHPHEPRPLFSLLPVVCADLSSFNNLATAVLCLGEQFMADEQSESAKAEQEKAQRERIEKLVTTLHFIKLEPYIAGNTKGAQQFPAQSIAHGAA